jgi:hypothetical protein
MDSNKFKLKYEEFKKLQPSSVDNISVAIGTYNGFILPDCECSARFVFGKTFLLDDEQAYVDFLQTIEGCDNPLKQIIAVQYFIDDYFGVGNDDKKRRMLNQSLKDQHSIKEYKGKNIAMCFERSTMAQNLFKLAGFDSMLVMKDGHTYNILQTEKSVILFDATNPILFNNSGNKFYLPALIIMPKDQAEGFLYGCEELCLNDEYVRKLYPNATDIQVPAIKYSGLNLEKVNNDETKINV